MSHSIPSQEYPCTRCKKQIDECECSPATKAGAALAKLRHKKNKPTKEFMAEIGKKGAEKRWKKKKLGRES